MASATLELDLDVFSGPFDLLLTLVLREEVDLLEVALADVVLAYLDHLDRRGELDLEVATEFLVLIAALLELKSRLMLPRADDELDDLEPGEAVSTPTAPCISGSSAAIDRQRGIVSTHLTRDANLDVDDQVTIVLDPFFDHRNGFFFQVNPAGARSDGQVSNNGERLTRDWDGIWDAVAAHTDEGWIAEIAIPFKTLRFRPGQTVWGFNVERQIKRRRNRSVGGGAPEHLDWNLAEAGRSRDWRACRQGLVWTSAVRLGWTQ